MEDVFSQIRSSSDIATVMQLARQAIAVRDPQFAARLDKLAPDAAAAVVMAYANVLRSGGDALKAMNEANAALQQRSPDQGSAQSQPAQPAQPNQGQNSPSVQSPDGWGALTQQEQASYMANNPNMAAITQAGQNAFGMTSLGMAQQALSPQTTGEQMAIAHGMNPAGMTFGSPGLSVLGIPVIGPSNLGMNSNQLGYAPVGANNNGSSVGSITGNMSGYDPGSAVNAAAAMSPDGSVAVGPDGSISSSDADSTAVSNSGTGGW